LRKLKLWPRAETTFFDRRTTKKRPTYVCMYACMHASMYAHVCLCRYVSMTMNVRMPRYVWHTYVCVYAYVCMAYLCMCVCIPMFVCMAYLCMCVCLCMSTCSSFHVYNRIVSCHHAWSKYICMHVCVQIELESSFFLASAHSCKAPFFEGQKNRKLSSDACMSSSYTHMYVCGEHYVRTYVSTHFDDVTLQYNKNLT
jgi:hypothetical protein